jgi:hypothetical protein
MGRGASQLGNTTVRRAPHTAPMRLLRELLLILWGLHSIQEPGPRVLVERR